MGWLGILLIIISGSAMILNDTVLIILAALGMQYIAAGLLLAASLSWAGLAAKMAGWVVAVVILYLSIRTRGAARLAARSESPVAGRLFRASALLLVITAAIGFGISGGLPLPEIPLLGRLGTVLSMSIGLLVMGLNEGEPVAFSAGLLMLLSGFEVSYNLVEPSLAVLTLLSSVHIGIALTASFLMLLSERGEGTAGR